MIKNSKFSAKNIIYSLFSGNFKPQVTYKGIPLLYMMENCLKTYILRDVTFQYSLHTTIAG